jgi:hypothetical protein
VLSSRPRAVAGSGTPVGFLWPRSDRLRVGQVAKVLSVESLKIGVGFVDERPKPSHELSAVAGERRPTARRPARLPVQELQPQVVLGLTQNRPRLAVRHAERLRRLAQRTRRFNQNEEVEHAGSEERFTMLVEKDAMTNADAGSPLARRSLGFARPATLSAKFAPGVRGGVCRRGCIYHANPFRHELAQGAPLVASSESIAPLPQRNEADGRAAGGATPWQPAGSAG